VRDLVRSKVSQKFDGDYNVLLKDLLVAIPTPEKLLQTKLNSNLKMSTNYPDNQEPVDPGHPVEAVDLEELAAELSEPMLVNGEEVYPQIYIPFFEELTNTNDEDIDFEDPCIGSSIPVEETPFASPVIVAYDGDESTPIESVNGYAYDMAGNIVFDVIVDKCYASRREIWVISINEHPPHIPLSPTSTAPPPPPPAPMDQVAYISTMLIKADKESWLKGANDVYITYTMSWENGINPANNQFGYKTFELSYISKWL